MAQIGLSTAAFCLWDITAPEKLEICNELGFDEIQIALSSVKMVKAFLAYLDQKPFNFSFKKIALHAPWCGVHYGEGAKSARVLNAIQAIHEKLQLETVVVRVDSIANAAVLSQIDLPISIENSNRDGAWERFKLIVDQTELPITLNVNRAVRDTDYLDELLRAYSSRINRVLLSGFSDDEGRMPLLAANQMSLLSKVQTLKVPMILEGLFKPYDKMAILHERQAVLTYLKTTGIESPLHCSMPVDQAASA